MSREAPGLRLVFRQTHSRLVADMLSARDFDLAITSGGFARRSLSREAVGEGAYACLVDPASLAPGQTALSLDDFLARPHILVSSGGFVGVVDEILPALKRERQVLAATTHFAVLPFLLRGSTAVTTLPRHAARAIAATCGLTLLPCPLVMPKYPVELGWRADSLKNPAVLKVKSVAAALLADCDWQA